MANVYEDKTIYIIDINKLTEERQLQGHGNDLQCIRYHPSSSLLASGSKDHSIRLWDPRIKDEILSINRHNNNVNRVEWNANGKWLATGSKD